MKTLLGIITGLVLMSLISCSEQQAVITSEYNHNAESKFKKLEEKIQISSGYISVYKYGEDTLYIVEGRGQSYPVGITIK
jgi:hypothetical protein